MKKIGNLKDSVVLSTLMSCLLVGSVSYAKTVDKILSNRGVSLNISDEEYIVDNTTRSNYAVEFLKGYQKPVATLNVSSKSFIVQKSEVAYDGSFVYGIDIGGANAYIGNVDSKKIDVDLNDTIKTDKRTYTIGVAARTYSNIKAHINLTADEVNINVVGDSSGNVIGLYAQNNNDTIAPSDSTDTSEIIINAKHTNINVVNNNSSGTSAGITAFSGSRVVINSDVEIDADKILQTRGNAVTKINSDGTHTTKLNGDVDFNIDKSGGKKADAVVDINLTNKDSFWKGNIIKTNPDNVANAIMTVTGMKLSVTNDAKWTTDADSFVNDLNLADGGTVNITNISENGQKVDIGNLTGDGGVVTTNNLANKMNITNSSASDLTVKGSGSIADAIAADARKAQDLANVVTAGSGENAKSAASKITTDEGIIAGVFSADVGNDGQVIASTAKTETNTSNEAISNMGSISLMTWRQENNDMNKRLGELRDSKGEHGAWARMARGESKYGAQNVKNQYNYYQVGYDEKLSTNPSWTVGVALTRTEGNSTFANGIGENKHTGFAVYGSYLNDNGSFIDLIAKYARLDNEFIANGGVGSGDYKNNGYSLSAEYGKRFTNESGAWIEPQVELTYGKVSSADYLTSEGAKVHQNSMDSLVARIGFALGKDIKAGNVYARASYLYDFDGETDVSMTKDGLASSFSQDLGGCWWEVGVGTNINLSDATHLYFDVEKTFGGNVATPWQWNAGIRWSF